MMNKKLFVIGAGIGGLTTAALLSKRGFDVTVLEAHVEPGGCAATFFHQGYRFDVGATLVGGFQIDGPHDLVARELGIVWPVRSIEPAMQVHLPDRLITRYGDADRWREERLAAFGGSTEKFWTQQERAANAVWNLAARIPGWPMASLQDAFGLISSLRPELIPTMPLAFTNMQAWSQRLGATDRTFKTFLDAQLLISAQAIAADTNALYGAAALDLYRRGVAHAEGGIGNIAETLATAVKANGGRVLYRHEVTSIRRGAHSTIETNRGSFETDAIIANLTPWALTQLLGEDAPAAFIKRTSNLKSSWGAFTLYLGVDAAAIEEDLEHHQIVVDADQPLGEGNSAFVSISPAWDATRAPAGQRALTISTHTRVSNWYECVNEESAFEDRKNRYTEKLIDAASIALPELRSHIRLSLPGTPVTFERYTRRVNGMVGGFPQTSLWSGWSPKIDRNLWLVGDSIFPGQSTAGVTLGALRVAREIERTISVHHQSQINTKQYALSE